MNLKFLADENIIASLGVAAGGEYNNLNRKNYIGKLVLLKL